MIARQCALHIEAEKRASNHEAAAREYGGWRVHLGAE